MSNNLLKSQESFTLVELVMVMVIIGLLASIVVPRFAGQKEQAKVANTKANLDALRKAVELYSSKGEHSSIPP